MNDTEPHLLATRLIWSSLGVYFRCRICCWLWRVCLWISVWKVFNQGLVLRCAFALRFCNKSAHRGQRKVLKMTIIMSEVWELCHYRIASDSFHVWDSNLSGYTFALALESKGFSENLISVDRSNNRCNAAFAVIGSTRTMGSDNVIISRSLTHSFVL